MIGSLAMSLGRLECLELRCKKACWALLNIGILPLACRLGQGSSISLLSRQQRWLSSLPWPSRLSLPDNTARRKPRPAKPYPVEHDPQMSIESQSDGWQATGMLRIREHSLQGCPAGKSSGNRDRAQSLRLSSTHQLMQKHRSCSYVKTGLGKVLSLADRPELTV